MQWKKVFLTERNEIMFIENGCKDLCKDLARYQSLHL